MRFALADPVTVLQDPNVAASSVENRVGFLRSKNLTQEEIDHALARTGAASPVVTAPYSPQGSPQPYYPPYQQQAWQPQPPPRRDWRDWFIMATLVGGVSYGVYSLGKVSSCTGSRDLESPTYTLHSAMYILFLPLPRQRS